MSWSAIRTALKTRLEAVSGIGIVHPFRRYVKGNETSPDFQTLFFSGGKLHAWQFYRTARRPQYSGSDDSRRVVHHDVVVEALLALCDSTTSEHTLQDLLDSVAANLETGDHTLGGACKTHSLLTVATIDHVAFFNTTCNHARATITFEDVV